MLMTSAEWCESVASSLGVAWADSHGARVLRVGRVRVLQEHGTLIVACDGDPSSGREGGAGGLGGSVWLGGNIPDPAAFATAVRALDAGDPQLMRALEGDP